ncbi:hypothetical protein GCM10027517_14840 [Phycicoccus ginsengisoli]
MAVGSVVLAKVLAAHLGGVALALALLGLTWSADLAIIAQRQYQSGRSALSGTDCLLDGAHVLRTWVCLVVSNVAMLAIVILIS